MKRLSVRNKRRKRKTEVASSSPELSRDSASFARQPEGLQAGSHRWLLKGFFGILGSTGLVFLGYALAFTDPLRLGPTEVIIRNTEVLIPQVGVEPSLQYDPDLSADINRLVSAAERLEVALTSSLITNSTTVPTAAASVDVGADIQTIRGQLQSLSEEMAAARASTVSAQALDHSSVPASQEKVGPLEIVLGSPASVSIPSSVQGYTHGRTRDQRGLACPSSLARKGEFEVSYSMRNSHKYGPASLTVARVDGPHSLFQLAAADVSIVEGDNLVRFRLNLPEGRYQLDFRQFRLDSLNEEYPTKYGITCDIPL